LHPGQQYELRFNSCDQRKVRVAVKKWHAIADGMDGDQAVIGGSGCYSGPAALDVQISRLRT
jgi:hypothetical protein